MKSLFIAALAVVVVLSAHAEIVNTARLEHPGGNAIDDFGPLHEPELVLSFHEGPVSHNFGIAWDGESYWTVSGGVAPYLLNRYDENGSFQESTVIGVDGRGIVYNPLDDHLYLSSYQGNIHRVDDPYTDYATTLLETGVMSNPQASLGMSWEGDLLYDHDNGTVRARDFWTYELMGSLSGFEHGNGHVGGECSIIADTDYLYTIDASTGTVYVYTLTGTYVDSFNLPYGDFGGSLSIANNLIWLVDDSDGGVGTYYGYNVRDWTDSAVRLDLSPQITQIPPGGGVLFYDAHLVSDLAFAVNNLRYQTFARLPNGQDFGPISTIFFTMTAFMDAYVPDLSLTVPAWAPPGDYTFEGVVSIAGNPTLQLTDRFRFNVGALITGFEEDFADNQAQGFNWFTEDGTLVIEDGYAKLDMSETAVWGSGAYEEELYSTFTLQAVIENHDDLQHSRGVMFCANGPRDVDFSGYAFYISLADYAVYGYANGSYVNIIPWTTSAHILAGDGEVNTLAVHGSDGTYDLFVNGQYLDSFTDFTYANGYVGVLAMNNLTWFDEIVCSLEPLSVAETQAEHGVPLAGHYDDMRNPVSEPIPTSETAVVFDRSAEIFAPGREYTFDPAEWTRSSHFISSDTRQQALTPTGFELEQAHPNPFNPSTTVKVSLPEAADLNVSVYNVNGQLVATLANAPFAAGSHTLTFDASELASGLYFIHASVPGHTSQVRKVMLVR